MAFDIQALIAVADSIAALLQPHAEVVLHDLVTGKIVHIANPFSGRKIGDDSLTELHGARFVDRATIGPYLKINWDGRPIKSVSAVLADGNGNPVGLLCVNLDMTVLTTLHAAVGGMLRCAEGAQQPSVLFDSDWREDANMIIGGFLAERGLTVGTLRPADRDELAAELGRRGVFEMRNGTPYVAALLGISRATLYKSLRASRAAMSKAGQRNVDEASTAGEAQR